MAKKKKESEKLEELTELFNAGIEFDLEANGTVEKLQTNVSVKLMTNPYENISFNAGMDYKPNKGVELKKAYSGMWAKTIQEIVEKMNEIRTIYPKDEK